MHRHRNRCTFEFSERVRSTTIRSIDFAFRSLRQQRRLTIRKIPWSPAVDSFRIPGGESLLSSSLQVKFYCLPRSGTFLSVHEPRPGLLSLHCHLPYRAVSPPRPPLAVNHLTTHKSEMPPGEFRDEDARNSRRPLPCPHSVITAAIDRGNRSDREIAGIPVRLARRDKIGGTEATLDASRGRERAPSGRSSRLEVRSEHLASFLGLLVPGQTRGRTALRAFATKEGGRGDVDGETRRDRRRARRRASANVTSSSPEPQHGGTGEKLRENPAMPTARPASDCRENGAGIQLSGIARLEGSSAPLARSLALSLARSRSPRPSPRYFRLVGRRPFPHRSAVAFPLSRYSLRPRSLPLGCPPGFHHHPRLLP